MKDSVPESCTDFLSEDRVNKHNSLVYMRESRE